MDKFIENWTDPIDKSFETWFLSIDRKCSLAALVGVQILNQFPPFGAHKAMSRMVGASGIVVVLPGCLV